MSEIEERICKMQKITLQDELDYANNERIRLACVISAKNREIANNESRIMDLEKEIAMLKNVL